MAHTFGSHLHYILPIRSFWTPVATLLTIDCRYIPLGRRAQAKRQPLSVSPKKRRKWKLNGMKMEKKRTKKEKKKSNPTMDSARVCHLPSVSVCVAQACCTRALTGRVWNMMVNARWRKAQRMAANRLILRFSLQTIACPTRFCHPTHSQCLHRPCPFCLCTSNAGGNRRNLRRHQAIHSHQALR